LLSKWQEQLKNKSIIFSKGVDKPLLI